mmetsp:Transcript_74754/g.192939  ORF Transcript_74754/g.192939 Transcript_74754/m.192939 type:complete len:246 (-) Transcript_74754:9-746(-)
MVCQVCCWHLSPVSTVIILPSIFFRESFTLPGPYLLTSMVRFMLPDASCMSFTVSCFAFDPTFTSTLKWKRKPSVQIFSEAATFSNSAMGSKAALRANDEGHPTASLCTSQYASTVTPALHAWHSALISWQHPFSRTTLSCSLCAARPRMSSFADGRFWTDPGATNTTMATASAAATDTPTGRSHRRALCAGCEPSTLRKGAPSSPASGVIALGASMVKAGSCPGGCSTSKCPTTGIPGRKINAP